MPVQRPTVEAATQAFGQIHNFIFADQPGWQLVQNESSSSKKANNNNTKKPSAKRQDGGDGVVDAVQKVVSPEEDEFYTDLHKAAEEGQADKIIELLDAGFNPALSDVRGRKPYQLAQTKNARDAFRTWRGAHEEDDDLCFSWEDSLIPEGITDDTLAAKQAKEKEKQAKKRARQKAKKAEEKAKAEAEKKKEEEAEAKKKAAHPSQKCDNCGNVLPKKPFYAASFAYCSTECVREHKRKLQLARFS